MTGASDTFIAGKRTAEDWREFRQTLRAGGDASVWQKAFEEYFLGRLNLRYLHPIRILQEHGTFQGEGFSIAAIQCTLIEFLESTVQGISYRHLRKGETLGPHEYSASGDVFVNFLCKREPFLNDFDEALAREFYVGVRCGLLHEARTKNGWRIWAAGPLGKIIDGSARILYRNNFQAALETFIIDYGKALQEERVLQDAFIRKFDSLCV
jgi:hypothetical protein